MNRLTVLNVAYPLARVGPDVIGTAEQLISQIDRALVRAGHHSIVVACEGSRSRGHLVATPCRDSPPIPGEDDELLRAQRAAIADALARWPVDVVHLHGVDFSGYLPPPGPPTLVTLHLPPDWYPPEVFFVERPETYLHCVSHSQRAACPPCAELLPVIENGVPIDELRGNFRKRNYAVAMGRICWEKGFHLALEASHTAGMPLLLAGNAHVYPADRDYFANQILPRLDRFRRFLGPVSFRAKRRLLGSARALLVTSLVPETSSLVAMEALACGTPVIAFRTGALTEIVEDGRTGFLVDNAEEMAAALQSVDALDGVTCRRAAAARFSAEQMTAKYLDTYEQLANRGYFAAQAGREEATRASRPLHTE